MRPFGPRSPLLGALQAPSPWLAVLARGDDPPEPPDAALRAAGASAPPPSGARPLAPRAPPGGRDAGHPPRGPSGLAGRHQAWHHPTQVHSKDAAARRPPRAP